MVDRQDWNVHHARADHIPTIRAFLTATDRKHLHLDWMEVSEYLERSPFLIGSVQGVPAACLSNPPYLKSVSWLRLFAVSSGYDLQPAWDALWQIAERQAIEQGIGEVYVLATVEWLHDLLQNSDFTPFNRVVFLEREEASRLSLQHEGPPIQPMTLDDVDEVLRLDHRAFHLPWQMDEPSLKAAFHHPLVATVLKSGRWIIGYQITTLSAFGAHLARIAVEPDLQNRGLGRNLVVDMLDKVHQRGYETVSVNTQEDNQASLRLYRQLDFQISDLQYLVYQKTLEGI